MNKTEARPLRAGLCISGDVPSFGAYWDWLFLGGVKSRSTTPRARLEDEWNPKWHVSTMLKLFNMRFRTRREGTGSAHTVCIPERKRKRRDHHRHSQSKEGGRD